MSTTPLCLTTSERVQKMRRDVMEFLEGHRNLKDIEGVADQTEHISSEIRRRFRLLEQRVTNAEADATELRVLKQFFSSILRG